MSLLDRAVRGARHELEPMEGLIGCVEGREAGGRRRVVAIATDRRLLLVMPRRTPATRIDYGDISDVCMSDGPDGPVLRIEAAGQVHEITRVTDRHALELFVQLVATRSESPPRPRDATPRVRIIA